MGVQFYSKDPLALVNNMDSYFRQMPTDCSLFSEDGNEVQVHKELLFQTKYLRKMIKSLKMDYSRIEIMCPSLSSEELQDIVKFLYSGKISCTDQSTASHIFQNLTQLFGFPSKNFDFNGTLLKSESQDTEQGNLLRGIVNWSSLAQYFVYCLVLLQVPKLFEPVQMFWAGPKVELHLVLHQNIYCWHTIRIY